MNVRYIIIIFFYLVGILFSNNLVYGKDENSLILKKIKEFFYVNGKPHSLSSVYNVETSDSGFSAFYVYFWKKMMQKLIHLYTKMKRKGSVQVMMIVDVTFLL
ncbi:hypothetical protein [Photorhabdus sp. RM96S]|uniref:hypothetical protein n=1 Tax=Photorhabdus sp. RM96S TaxID=3342822 RepID=UPI0036DF4820